MEERQWQLLVTATDIKNELDIDLATDLNMQPRQVERWIYRVQSTILNHVARYRYGGAETLYMVLANQRYKAAIEEAIVEQVEYLSTNNYVQPEKVMNTSKGQVAEPVIAPLAHQILLNAGVLYTGAGYYV